MRGGWLHTGGVRFVGGFGLAVAVLFMIPRLLSDGSEVSTVTLVALWAMVGVVTGVGIRLVQIGVRVVPPALIVRNLLRTHRVDLADIRRVGTRVKWGGHMGYVELADGRNVMMHGLQQANPFTSRKPLDLLNEALATIHSAVRKARSDA